MSEARICPPRSGFRLKIEHVAKAYAERVLARQFSLEELECYRDFVFRLECGEDVPMTEEESRIYEAYTAEKRRFAQLAGFESITEFNHACGWIAVRATNIRTDSDELL